MSLSLSCRNIPLAVIVSVITVIVGYMLTNISYYTVLGMQDVLASPAVAVVSRHPPPRYLSSVWSAYAEGVVVANVLEMVFL